MGVGGQDGIPKKKGQEAGEKKAQDRVPKVVEQHFRNIAQSQEPQMKRVGTRLKGYWEWEV